MGESEAKLRYPPWRPADLVDFLLARQDEPCGRTVPEAILKAIFWVERVAEFPEEQRATHGRLAWAAKDKITEILSSLDQKSAPLPRVPPSSSGGAGARPRARYWLEGLGLGQARYKVWGSLRWSDLQAIIPAELALVEGRLVTTLRRTKTSVSRSTPSS